MRVLVTGGAGFIGREVVAELSARGDDVVVLDSLREDVHGPAAVADERTVVGDVRDPGAVERALTGCDAVVHLAAKVGLGVSLADIDDYVSSNDLGTAVLLRAAEVPHIVYASSMVVYGEGRYDCREHGQVAPSPRRAEDLEAGLFEPRCPVCSAPLRPGLVTEDARLDPRNVYAATKAHGEMLLAAWARQTGAGATALRFHNVYGPGMPRDTPYAGVAALFRSAVERGEAPTVLEDGQQRRDFVHVTDVARAVAAAVAQPRTAGRVVPLNVGSGVVTTVGEMAQVTSKLLAGPEPVVTGGYRLGDVRHVTASSEAAAQALGWRARTGLEEGLATLA
ncbi:NAD-dependent epimerase/dehydratase family protein [Promicromonospora kroppenstedtii]|uniref:NAD-dependent epimerase/dehydratase family protein n=1 Tax=Promicromonospora kroppenstedtii TaxID=440482 RepID=UPI000564FCEA|nr:NAD-dependent epimerase/dehydratase family protein [Promicromonospora kroppenstedtii]